MKQKGEDITEDQINYIKEYLAKSNPVELHRVSYTDTEKERNKLLNIHQFEQIYKKMSSEQQQHFKEKFTKLKNMTDKEIAVELVKLGERENKGVSEIEK